MTTLVARPRRTAALALTAAAALAPATEAIAAPEVGRCKTSPAAGDAPAEGMDTTSLGPEAPAPYEIGEPTSREDAGEPAKRVVILVHGGGWRLTGWGGVAQMRNEAEQWRRAGWRTVNVDYRSCRRSVGDVQRFYDIVRGQVGPDVPVGLSGQSAGGHLSLMVAARRPDVSFVVSQAGPTDLWTIAAQAKAAAAAGTGPAALAENGVYVHRLAKSAFGKSKLRSWSPASNAARIGARVLVATAETDPLVPPAQGDELVSAVQAVAPDRHAVHLRLPAGRVQWVHSGVAAEAPAQVTAAIGDLVAPFGRGPGQPEPAAKPIPFFQSLFSKLFRRGF